MFCSFEEGVDARHYCTCLPRLSDDELRALIAAAQAILRMRTMAETPIAQDPAIGMWADREDMQDSAAPDEISDEEFSSCRSLVCMLTGKTWQTAGRGYVGSVSSGTND